MCPDIVLKIHSVKILWVLGSVNSYILTNFIAIVILYHHPTLSFANLPCVCTKLPIWLFHFGNILLSKILGLPHWECDLYLTPRTPATSARHILVAGVTLSSFLLVINSLLISCLHDCPPHHLFRSPSSFILMTNFRVSVVSQKEYINIDCINEWLVISFFWLHSLLMTLGLWW